MDNATRLQYLQAMGIEFWVSRTQAQSLEQSNPAYAWSQLQTNISQCQACSLAKTRTQTVFGAGNQQADWLIIDAAPGPTEDLQGQPLLGSAGHLFNEMLLAIGLNREQVFITQALKCHPPIHIQPTAEQFAACAGFLQQQIKLIQPKIILAIGTLTGQILLDNKQALYRLTGIQHQLNGIPLVVAHHPAELLQALPEKAKAWQDLQFAWSVYQSVKN